MVRAVAKEQTVLLALMGVAAEEEAVAELQKAEMLLAAVLAVQEL